MGLEISKLFSSPNFHPIHPNFIQGVIIIQAALFCHLPKIAKIMALWNFLNTGPYAAGISFFPTIFIEVHPSFVTKLATMVNLNASYCNDKLASSTCDNIFYLKLFKTFLYTGLFSSSRASRPLGLLLDIFFPTGKKASSNPPHAFFYVEKNS